MDHSIKDYYHHVMTTRDTRYMIRFNMEEIRFLSIVSEVVLKNGAVIDITTKHVFNGGEYTYTIDRDFAMKIFHYLDDNLRARQYDIPSGISDYSETEEKIIAEALEKEIKELGLKPAFGDFIWDSSFDDPLYDNDNLFIWNGKNVLPVWEANSSRSEIDLPDCFSVWVEHPEYGFIIPPKYWGNNAHVNFDFKPYLDKMTIKYDNILLKGKYAFYATWDNYHFIIYNDLRQVPFEGEEYDETLHEFTGLLYPETFVSNPRNMVVRQRGTTVHRSPYTTLKSEPDVYIPYNVLDGINAIYMS